MRSDADKLRSCPTCGVPAEETELGLRDYRWVEDLLPGRISATDVDFLLEQHSTGRVLVLEFKPNKYIPRGQQLMFEWFRSRGADVYVVVDRNQDAGHYTLGTYHLDNVMWRKVTHEELRSFVKGWWEAGLS